MVNYTEFHGKKKKVKIEIKNNNLKRILNVNNAKEI